MEPCQKGHFIGRWLLKSSLQDMRNCLFKVRPAVVSICFHDVDCSSDRCTWALKMMLSKFMSSLLARVTIFAFHVSSFGPCTLRFFTDSVQWNLGTGQMRFLKKDAKRSASSQDVDFNYWCVQNMSELPVLLLWQCCSRWGRSGSGILVLLIFSRRHRSRVQSTGLRQKHCSETKVNEITCVASSHNTMK